MLNFIDNYLNQVLGTDNLPYSSCSVCALKLYDRFNRIVVEKSEMPTRYKCTIAIYHGMGDFTTFESDLQETFAGSVTQAAFWCYRSYVKKK